MQISKGGFKQKTISWLTCTPKNQHDNAKTDLQMYYIKWGCSIAMLVYRRVSNRILVYSLHWS